MPNRADFDNLNALITEAAALCSAAQERFEQILAELQKATAEGRLVADQTYFEEEMARRSLFDARALLTKRRLQLQQMREGASRAPAR